jgi:N-acetylglutamate synthase-like GNAT family acetyltransferase
MIEVRLAQPDDSGAMAEVLSQAFGMYREHYTPEAFTIVTPCADEITRRNEDGPQWIAMREGEVIGTVSVTVEDGDLYVRSMAVAPHAQGLGVGHLLLDAIDEYAQATEHDRIFLYTTCFSLGAKELYEKHGYSWVRDTTGEEWYGVPGLEMDKKIERNKTNAVGS